jgi:hypothetical protein
MAGIGYILLGTLRNENARYGMCFLAITVYRLIQNLSTIPD